MLDKIFTDDRKREYLNSEGRDRPLISPIPHEVLLRARAYRKQRMVDEVIKHDCAAILMYDPLNTRYVFDAPNMQLWATHNAFRYGLLFADGYAIDYQYKQAQHLAEGIKEVDEIRPAYNWFYFSSGERTEEFVEKWADDLVATLKARNGGNMRLAVDKLEPDGVFALKERGVEIINGQRISELARVVKSPDELELMKWTIRVCEAGMARIYENSLPGKSENEIWAELHYENIRSGGEWIETRLLAIGERTNPWFQECSGFIGQKGDILAFDTDMIGPYGYCADLSRTWTIGYTKFDNIQRDLYAYALEQIEHNSALIKAGMSFAEFNDKSWRIPERFQERRYSVSVHGVGLCDEYPAIPTHLDFAATGYDGIFEENSVICVEALIGEENGKECVKLETQAVVTANGLERLDTFPWEEI